MILPNLKGRPKDLFKVEETLHLQFGMKRGKLKHLREIIIPSIKPSSSRTDSAASTTAATLMLKITRLRVSLPQRIKGLQVVFRELLPFLLMLILGIPTQATTVVLLCSHHAFRQTALAALTASVAGGQSPSLTHNSSLHERLWGSEEGNVKF